MNQKNIRNFAIIAHIDHGKSTLSDRMLELTQTIAKDKLQEQFLDQNPISRERGITIKLAPVRMLWHPNIENSNTKIPARKAYALAGGRNTKQIQNDKNSNDQNELEFRNSDLEFANSAYELNLIDTPGHVDFSYEVSRTLAACEGAILLVDGTQGIQAQTVAHFREAKKQNLTIIPVINKIDLPNAQPESVVKELDEIFGFQKDSIIFISAKTGQNIPLVLKAIVEQIPSPQGEKDKPLRALIFDAVYDEYRGVVTYVKIIDGKVKKGDKVQLYQSKVTSEVTEVGYFSPFLKSIDSLETGEIGYIITGIKNIRDCRVGDTITSAKFKVQSFDKTQDKSSKLMDDEGNIIEPLPGYKIPKPMVFFGMYPKQTKDIARLKEALGKLTLNDTSLTYSDEYSAYLGSGYRVGFLGLLHADIVKERLKREFGLDLLLTMPQVLYEKDSTGTMLEPYMKLTVYAPSTYVGNVMSICQNRKGELKDMIYHDLYAELSYEIPYSMFIRGLSAELKSASSGYVSLDYELSTYRPANLVNLEIHINTNPIDVLSEYVYKDEAIFKAREKAQKLKDTLDRQQFRQIIQGVIDGNIVAREEIPPFRKDVLQKMSGGDRTRKDKLLEAQKKGKAKMIQTGKVNLPQSALFSLIES